MSEKVTIATLRQYKQQGQPIAMLTAYDHAVAVLVQQGGVDGILVGDSLAQLVLGHSATINATMDIMITLTAAVRRGAPDVYLVGDMPFLSYQVSVESALVNAGRFLTEAGCDCVKLELHSNQLDLVGRLSDAGIPVMAHLGLRPQQIRQMGRLRAQAQTAETAGDLVRDVADMVQAGACAILLECVPAEVAGAITQRTEVPVLSCGSGPECDGQLLVLHDVLGLPGAGATRFAKNYAPIGDQTRAAVTQYVEEVRQGRYPDAEHSYHIKSAERQRFEQQMNELHINEQRTKKPSQ